MRNTIAALAVTVTTMAGVGALAGTAAAHESKPCQEAARAIVARIDSGQPLFEDLTWKGAPTIVGACNDTFLDAYTGPGTREDVADWLRATQV